MESIPGNGEAFKNYIFDKILKYSEKDSKSIIKKALNDSNITNICMCGEENCLKLIQAFRPPYHCFGCNNSFCEDHIPDYNKMCKNCHTSVCYNCESIKKIIVEQCYLCKNIYCISCNIFQCKKCKNYFCLYCNFNNVKSNENKHNSNRCKNC